MARRYVYYRVPEAAVADVLAALRTELEGGGVELLRRPGAVDGLVTLMEVYATGRDGALEARIARLIEPWLRGARRVEVFEPLR